MATRQYLFVNLAKTPISVEFSNDALLAMIDNFLFRFVKIITKKQAFIVKAD